MMIETIDSPEKIRYYEYLESTEWKQTRAQRIEIDGHKCKICGTEYDLQVHHITYERVYNENVSNDLITLCNSCHHRLHEQLEEYTCRFKEIILKTAEELHELVQPLQIKYTELQSDVLAEMLGEYSGKEFSNIQTITKLIRNSVKIDWYSVSRFGSAIKYGGKQLHSTAIKKAAQKRRNKMRYLGIERSRK